jgi:hypothetical protein
VGQADKASKQVEAALRVDRHHIGALEFKVNAAKDSGQTHQILSGLMQLSDAYDKHGKFQAFDKLQKEIRALRESM